MAKPNRNAPRRSGGTGKLLLGILLGFVLTVGGIVAYFYLGRPPVAVTDVAPMWEHLIGPIALHTRTAAEQKEPPFPANEDVFEAGAHTYRSECAQCHGTPGHDSPLGRQMAPRAQQFFSARDRRATAAQAPGELYWKTAFGIRRSGMPAYHRALSDTQMWQTSLLLHSVGDDLPDPVISLLNQGAPAAQPTVVKP